QPRAGPVDDAHRPDRLRPAQYRRLGRLWPRYRESEPARVRRAAGAARPACRWYPQLVERLDAAAFPGDAVPLGRGPSPEPETEGGPQPRRGAGPPGAPGPAECRSQVTAPGRTGARRSHRQLRTGRADAALRHGRPGRIQRNSPDAQALWARSADDWCLRGALPDGPASGRTGRA